MMYFVLNVQNVNAEIIFFARIWCNPFKWHTFNITLHIRIECVASLALQHSAISWKETNIFNHLLRSDVLCANKIEFNTINCKLWKKIFRRCWLPHYVWYNWICVSWHTCRLIRRYWLSQAYIMYLWQWITRCMYNTHKYRMCWHCWSNHQRGNMLLRSIPSHNYMPTTADFCKSIHFSEPT